MKVFTFHVQGSVFDGEFLHEGKALGFVSREGNNPNTRRDVIKEFRSKMPHCSNIRIVNIKLGNRGDCVGW